MRARPLRKSSSLEPFPPIFDSGESPDQFACENRGRGGFATAATGRTVNSRVLRSTETPKAGEPLEILLFTAVHGPRRSRYGARLRRGQALMLGADRISQWVNSSPLLIVVKAFFGFARRRKKAFDVKH